MELDKKMTQVSHFLFFKYCKIILINYNNDSGSLVCLFLFL